MFSDVSRWSAWSPMCRGCRILTGDRLEVGAILRMRLRLAGVTVPVHATVIDLRPPMTMTWEARVLGITAVHTYRFSPRGGGTVMANEERFLGLFFPLDALVFRWYTARGIGGASLHGMKRRLEREGGHGPLPREGQESLG